MKLLTKEIQDAFDGHPIRSQEGKGKNSKVLASFRTNNGPGVWIITEAEKQPDGDYLMFGLCEITEPEYGYVMLSELETVDIPIRYMIQDREEVVPHAIHVEADDIRPGRKTVEEVYEMYGDTYPFTFNVKARDSTDKPSMGRIGGLLHGHHRK